MSEPSLFRHYQIVQDAEGNNVELIRSAEQVAVLAFDSERLEFVHCHVLLEPLKNKESFTLACKTLQDGGHPLLASVIDFGEDDGNPFYITSNVDGETLRSYLQRQTELPLWLAAMVATRSLDAAIALGDCGDFLADQPLDSFRLVQTGASALQVQAADYRLLESPNKGKARLIKANFERQAKFLRTFLKEQGGGGPTLPDMMLSSVDFAELLGSSLSTGGPGLTGAMTELRNALIKMVPEHLAGEIPTAQKPRALVAPLLATYQEVARGVVNLVRHSESAPRHGESLFDARHAHAHGPPGVWWSNYRRRVSVESACWKLAKRCRSLRRSATRMRCCPCRSSMRRSL